MAKTTIILADDIYKKLVKEAVEKYGTTRTLSKLINEKLKEAEAIKTKGRLVDAKRKKSIVGMAFGAWGKGESGEEYVRKIRDQEEKRLKRMGL